MEYESVCHSNPYFSWIFYFGFGSKIVICDRFACQGLRLLGTQNVLLMTCCCWMLSRVIAIIECLTEGQLTSGIHDKNLFMKNLGKG